MNLTAKVIELLKAHQVDWPYSLEESELRRTNAGHWQRSAGAWGWFIWPTNDALAFDHSQPQTIRRPWDIGSNFTATELVKLGPTKTELYINPHGQVEILPNREGLQEMRDKLERSNRGDHRIQAHRGA